MRSFYLLLTAAFLISNSFSLNAQSRGSLSFTTGGQFVEVPTNPLEEIGEGDFTFEVWIRGLEDQPANHPTIFSNRTNSGGIMLFMHDVWRGSRTKILSLQLNGYNHKYVDNGALDAGLLTGECQHIAVTKVDGAVNLYVNGQLIGREGTAVSGSTVASGAPMLIGQDRVSNQPFEGNLSQLRIWNVARTQEEIAENKDLVLTGEETGLVAYYEMNDGAGQSLTDKAGDFNGRLGNANGQDAADPEWSVEDCVAAPVSAATLFAPGLVRAFPNPAREKVFIDYNGSETLSYALIDQAGRVVRKGITSRERTELGLEDLPRGMYFLSLSGRTNVLTQKLVLK